METLTTPPSSVSHSDAPLISTLSLVRQLVEEGEVPQALELADTIPLSSAEASEATQLMAGYMMWKGNFHTARHLIHQRLQLGMADSLALQVRRWQIQHYFLLVGQSEEPVVPNWALEDSLPSWMLWAKVLQRYALHTPEGMADFLEIAPRAEFQARIFTDETLRRLLESLVPLMERSARMANMVRDALENLRELPNPEVFRFGLGNFRSLYPRFAGIFRLDLLNDSVVLDAGGVHRHPEVYAEFLQWFWDEAGQTRALLEKLDHHRMVILSDSRHEAAVACLEAGQFAQARSYLLYLAADDWPRFRLAAQDSRLRLLGAFWQWVEECQARHPEALRELPFLMDLNTESQQIIKLIESIPPGLQNNPLVREPWARARLFAGDFQGALDLLEGLDSDYDPAYAVTRTLAWHFLERYEEAQEEVSAAPPAIALLPEAYLEILRKRGGKFTPLLYLYFTLPKVESADLQPEKGTFAVYLTRNEMASQGSHPLLPDIGYYRVARVATPGEALREARRWVRRALLNLGEMIPLHEDIFRFWLKTLGLQVVIVPDLRPHYSFSQQVERLLPEVLQELTEAEEAAEAQEGDQTEEARA